MPVYELTDDLVFPHPKLAEPDGLLAVGGDLSVERLLLAYANGIFPWYEKSSPILWWSPNPRMVLFPEKFKISNSLKQTIKKQKFKITFDCDFSAVIKGCAETKRLEQHGTWIVPEIEQAYNRLHEAGFAHSVEAWYDNRLAGGLYGVSIGKAFFGESMFYQVRDASKVALAFLVEKLLGWHFHFIDAQQETAHMISLGGELIDIDNFLNLLKNALSYPTLKGNWS
ncbi:MAG TPA: leucyl/phenylalanyl-tRNA--protein transferase [Bacteroidales bacterium]|nr:MAG: Leucyl/phenylalanyl-tRNA--protein transferase [Bacteroidetes bacterium ADurb.Bin041]HNV50938.1 leucyl/phenylalanyl-tRNA--protein transferase [Bacteroidales bacterium]HPW43457.1 leucyl/phenylalanyl-tRNA--protein transferase [Bacteroidales bacterium]